MHLKRIHLKNYRKYQDVDIEFPTGLIGIVGRNGSGKSTLIEAVGWCMYGNEAARTKKDEIKTTGISKGEDCSVTLEMIIGSDMIKIVRELKGKNDSVHASVFLNESASAHVRGTREVSEFVAKRTGMDHVAFFISVFAKQKELDSLSELRPGERKKIIMRLLRIDKIDNVISAIKRDIRISKDKILALKDNLEDIELLEGRQNKALEEEKQAIEQTKTHNEMIKELKVTVEREKVECTAHKKRYQKHNIADKNCVEIDEKVKSAKEKRDRTLSDLEDAETSEKKLQNILPQLKKYADIKKEKDDLDLLYGEFTKKEELTLQYKNIDSKIEKIRSDNEKFERDFTELAYSEPKLKEKEKRLAEQEECKEEVMKSVSASSSKLEESKRQRAKLQKEFSKIEKIGQDSKCPTCQRPLKDYLASVSKHFSDEISVLDEEIQADLKMNEQLKQNLQSIKKDIDKQSKDIDALETKKRDKELLQIQLQDGKKSLGITNKEKTGLESRLRKLSSLKYDRKHHLSINKQLAELSEIKDESIELSTDAKRIPNLSKQHNRTLKMISELEKKQMMAMTKLDSVGYDESEHQKAEDDLEHAISEHGKVREAWIQLKNDVKMIASEIAQIVKRIEDEKTKRVTIETENKKIILRSKLENIMNNFKQDLISRIRPTLSKRTSKLFSKITKGRYSMIELDEEYNIKIEDEGNSFTTDRFSGGEGDLANLCLRIAISQELAERASGMEVNFIALDEIFGSQDEERKKKILEALSELSNQFKQILVITHVEDVKEILPYVLSLKEDSENVTKIETEGRITHLAQ